LPGRSSARRPVGQLHARTGAVDRLDDLAHHAADRVRAALETAGTPIGAYDLLIAGQALRHDAILVTANTAKFSRVGDLRWEDWASPG
jgi:tRNA(fMet)-specific endonuclease VapC